VTGAAEFVFGAVVTCDDGECGALAGAIVTRSALEITHLIVRPRGRTGGGHLVPIDLVRGSTAGGVRLECTLSQYEALADAQRTETLPGPTPAELRQDDLQTEVSYHVFGRRADLYAPRLDEYRGFTDPKTVTRDDVPPGAGEVGRGQSVHASDGEIGHVAGLLADPSGRRVTHVLLDEGHLWGKKEVAVPLDAVKDVFENGVFCNLTKKQVGALPPADRAPH
jgi:hypothetical protein